MLSSGRVAVRMHSFNICELAELQNGSCQESVIDHLPHNTCWTQGPVGSFAGGQGPCSGDMVRDSAAWLVLCSCCSM
jgi:hypothetical protein